MCSGLGCYSNADDVSEFNVTQDADDFPDVNDNPDAFLDFDFSLITLEVNDGNVDYDEVSNVSPNSSDIREASVSSGGRDLFIGRSRQKIKQELASPNGSKIEGIVRSKLEPVFSFSASSVEILPEGNC